MKKIRLYIILAASLFVINAKSYGQALNDTEIDEMIEWASSMNQPSKDALDLKWVLRYFPVDWAYWMYNVENSQSILDNFVRFADNAIDKRNDNYTKYVIITGFTDAGEAITEVLPIWPTTRTEPIGEPVNGGDCGAYIVGNIYLSIAARAIVETPLVWDKTVPGKDLTYIELAQYYINEIFYSLDKGYFRKFVWPGTLEQRYLYDRTKEGGPDWCVKGAYVPFNRVWHAQLLFSHLNPALEQLGLYPEKVTLFDSIAEVSINTLMLSGGDIDGFDHTYYTKNNIDLLVYQYRYKNGREGEDIGHGAYDICLLGSMYRSGRYDRINREFMTRFANTMVNVVHDGQGKYYDYLNGYGNGKKPRSFYFQLAPFNPDLKNHVEFSESVDWLNRGFTQVDVNYTTDGEKWVSSKSIAVKKGDTLNISASVLNNENSWEWTGPNNFSANQGSITFENIDFDDAGTYKVSNVLDGGEKITNYVKVIVYDPDLKLAELNLPPRVRFDQPTESIFLEGQDLELLVHAEDIDGIAKVSLYMNDELVGVDSDAPYRWESEKLKNLAAGMYTFKAIAEDNKQKKSDISLEVQFLEQSNDGYIESFENVPFKLNSWGAASYIGDAGFSWEVDGKCVSGYLNESKGLYNKNKVIAQAEQVLGGISSFSVMCKNKWTQGESSSIELLVNDEVVGSLTTSSDNEEYEFKVDDINVEGSVKLALKIGANTIVVDNIKWQPYSSIVTETAVNTMETRQFQISPNPSNGQIRITNNSNTEIHGVALFDVKGKLVLKENIQIDPASQISFEINSSILNGTYVLKLIGTDVAESKKIQIRH